MGTLFGTILSFLIVFSGGGITLMILIAPPPVNYFYYAGLILVIIFGYACVFLRFVWATLGSLALVMLYGIASFLTDTPVLIQINNQFFFVSANAAGMLACYTIEYAIRQNFYVTHLLAEEQRKLQDANQRLESRVAERTEALEQTNRQLTREMSERQLAEQERRRLEAQLKQAEKMEAIGSLAAGVAHDLNNILVGLVSYPQLVLMRLPEDSPLREDIVQIQESGERAAAMVEDLLTMARLGVADSKVISLNDIVKNYLQTPEFHRLRTDHPHIRMETLLDPDLLNIRASEIQTTKALMNLATNGCEATLTDGVVSIETSNRYLERSCHGLETIPGGEYVVLGVRDTGVGIAKENLQRIFEPFYTKKRLGRSGTGLGMTVVWHTVKEMGGYIDVQSTEGQGTIFELYLPVTREETVKAPEPTRIDDYRGTERVLAVDDVKEQRKIAAAILGKLGYQVTTASSGEEAVKWIEDHEVDVVVLDMIMDPGIDGCETYRRMIQKKPGLKAVIVSGFSESERVKEAQLLGAGAYVRKPYTLDKIASAIRTELDRKRS